MTFTPVPLIKMKRPKKAQLLNYKSTCQIGTVSLKLCNFTSEFYNFHTKILIFFGRKHFKTCCKSN
ncbi:hypothetical protein BpHYR1_006253 [Brachionus plicatilis]|uniref:Uncharacterized protein n=1 Tax=Brachionus plicatilis TaxID=10195 RepID=A0A3M7RBK6_BRAPC|nr:hypothetical protein BpHYR1_006253 [Brachionus plicatilis]